MINSSVLYFEDDVKYFIQNFDGLTRAKILHDRHIVTIN